MLKSIFTWWNGATIGARFDIGRRAGYVGKDDTGKDLIISRDYIAEGMRHRAAELATELGSGGAVVVLWRERERERELGPEVRTKRKKEREKESL